ncbi:MAG: diiron oxygenase [Actinobacteria bacterium]|nr:diiron oxygenase [Actinomycetota bacterium]
MPDRTGGAVVTAVAPGDRERTAERLLRSTASRSYDPDIDIDWSAPLADGKGFMLAHRCSLYGTQLWEGLSPQQRIELGKHEIASVACTGIWLEFVLLRLLAKVAYEGDPASRHVQYALAEMAEECRHSTMFARLVERLGVPFYHPPATLHALGRLLPAIARGPALWGAVLLGEELTDRIQREQVEDETIQPLIRMVNRIHILEEARHIGFARAELTRTAAAVPRAELPYHRAVLARVGFLIARNLIRPDVYRAVGLEPRAARRVALANPYHQQTIRFSGEKVMAFLGDAGMVGPPVMHLWRRSFLLG